MLQGCVTPPPQQLDNLCGIFGERPGWYRDARDSAKRWGVPESVQAAIIHQESRFRARARPARRRFLWIIPIWRPSSAFGYGQVINGTWNTYVRSTGNWGADRDDFGDVADFIGWYGDSISKRTKIPKRDAGKLYLAYHEGPGGYLRGSHKKKSWLQGVAKKVSARAARYERQLSGCRQKLESSGSGFWPF